LLHLRVESHYLFISLKFSRVEAGTVTDPSMRIFLEDAERGGWVAPHDLEFLIEASGHAFREVLKSETAVYK
jgi:hypothetical protein